MTRLIPLTILSSTLLFTTFTSADRTLRVVNNCDVTLWPGLFSAVNPPDAATGWEAAPGDTHDLTLPTGWIGRVWPRTECDFSLDNPADQCSTGGCAGGLECTATGVAPASLAEFTIDADGLDWYDISLVDGFNVPMTIDNSGDCVVPECAADINAICPDELQVISPTSGEVVGCKSDCMVDPDPTNSSACCSGDFDTPATCPSSGVPNYNVFKKSCVDAYAYAYDESSKTALWTCPSAQQVDYTITFCPSSSSGSNSTEISSAIASASSIGASTLDAATTIHSPATTAVSSGTIESASSSSSSAIAVSASSVASSVGTRTWKHAQTDERNSTRRGWHRASLASA